MWKPRWSVYEIQNARYLVEHRTIGRRKNAKVLVDAAPGFLARRWQGHYTQKMTDNLRDDALTLASLGVVAFAVADQTHEALGHGLATLITGGKLIALTTCYVNSAGGSARWIPASGGLANLAVGMIALALLSILSKPLRLTRYFLVLVAAFNLFFASGYPAYSGIAAFGDWAAVISGLAPAWLWRTILVIIGVAGYYLSMQFIARAIRPFGSSLEGPTRDRLRRITLIPFLTALGLAFLGGLPNPRGWAMVFSAAVPAAAACFGLTQMDHLPEAYRPNPVAPAAEPIRRSIPWIVTGCLVAVLFVAILGPGIRFVRE